MLAWWRKTDKSLISISGVNSGGDPTPEWDFQHNIFPTFGGVIADYYVLGLDDATAYSIFAAGSVEPALDDQGNPVGVIVYPKLIAGAGPNPATVNATVTVMATLPAASPDTQVTFQVMGGQAFIEPVSNLQASHAFAFASAGTYQVAVSSAHHGTVWLEVVVQ